MSKHYEVLVTSTTTYCVEVGDDEMINDAIQAVHWRYRIAEEDSVAARLIPEQTVEQFKATADEVITSD